MVLTMELTTNNNTQEKPRKPEWLRVKLPIGRGIPKSYEK
jgi:lipoate synthase